MDAFRYVFLIKLFGDVLEKRLDDDGWRKITAIRYRINITSLIASIKQSVQKAIYISHIKKYSCGNTAHKI